MYRILGDFTDIQEKELVLAVENHFVDLIYCALMKALLPNLIVALKKSGEKHQVFVSPFNFFGQLDLFASFFDEFLERIGVPEPVTEDWGLCFGRWKEWSSARRLSCLRSYYYRLPECIIPLLCFESYGDP